MSFDKSFIVLISERLGIQEAVVKETIDQLFVDIRERVSNQEEVALGNFGFFYLKQNGTIGFRPTAQTQADINFRYFNLAPIPVGDPEPHDEGQVLDSPIVVLIEEPKPEIPPSLDHDSSLTVTIEPPAYPVTPIDAHRTSENTPHRRNPFSRIKSSKINYRRKKVFFYLIIFLLCFFSLIGLLREDYFYHELITPLAKTYLFKVNEDASVITLPLLTQQADKMPKAQGSDSTTSFVMKGDALNTSQEFGFRGSYDSTLSGYYTIISKSFFNEEAANLGYESALNYGYRIRMVKLVITNRPIWQLHIGQFPNRAMATDALDSLKQAFRSVNIVKVD